MQITREFDDLTNYIPKEYGIHKELLGTQPEAPEIHLFLEAYKLPAIQFLNGNYR